jgi:hypothetical protein
MMDGNRLSYPRPDTDRTSPNQQPMTTPSRAPSAAPPPRRVQCPGGLQFLVINGRRMWLEQPPAKVLPDLLGGGI